jgi:hypothetical protein
MQLPIGLWNGTWAFPWEYNPNPEGALTFGVSPLLQGKRVEIGNALPFPLDGVAVECEQLGATDNLQAVLRCGLQQKYIS